MKKIMFFLLNLLLFLGLNGCSNSGAYQDIADIKFSWDVADAENFNFSCKPNKSSKSGVETKCVNYDDGIKLLGIPVAQRQITFNESGDILSVSLELPETYSTIQGYLDLSTKLSDIYTAIDHPMNGGHEIARMDHWKTSEGLLVRLVVQKGIKGILPNSVTVLYFTKAWQDRAESISNK